MRVIVHIDCANIVPAATRAQFDAIPYAHTASYPCKKWNRRDKYTTRSSTCTGTDTGRERERRDRERESERQSDRWRKVLCNWTFRERMKRMRRCLSFVIQSRIFLVFTTVIDDINHLNAISCMHCIFDVANHTLNCRTFDEYWRSDSRQCNSQYESTLHSLSTFNFVVPLCDVRHLVTPLEPLIKQVTSIRIIPKWNLGRFAGKIKSKNR